MVEDNEVLEDNENIEVTEEEEEEVEDIEVTEEEVGEIQFENNTEVEGDRLEMPVTTFKELAAAKKLKYYVYCYGCKLRGGYTIQPGDGIETKILVKDKDI